METQLNDSNNLFSAYEGRHSYDEMVDAKGGILPHWKELTNNLQALGSKELHERQEEILWYLKENGVTYHVYKDPLGHKRTWRLNAVPLVIDENDWRETEKGLKQRAEILNLIYQDLYGERTLIKQNIIPPHIIYAHRGFLYPCCNIPSFTPRSLQVFAADMARGPDGRMWIINDRAQAPSGMGYALENRLTISSVIPELLQGVHIRRLKRFFQDLKAMLYAAAPPGCDDPVIAILTPGPRNETYFEHSYLASYLGYPLVQGSDLVAREGRLWLKSITGLKPIDVLLRRVDDDYCDPLELRSDSYLGVAGLLDVARQGNISIINPIGTGVLENPGLISFMSNIARYFLGEDLKLPQVATWWCGQKKEREHVLAHLDKLIIKHINQNDSDSHFIGHLLSKQQKEELKRKILDTPHLYVGQEQVSFSTVPTFTREGFEPRNAFLRAFLISGEQDYSVMPGGLVRVAPDNDDYHVSNQRGGESKDIWILGSKPEDEPLSIPPTQEGGDLPLLQSGSLDDLSSRMAENLFWVGRYTGRAIWSARYIRTTIRLILGAHYREQETNHETIRQLCLGLTHLSMTYPGFLGPEGEMMLRNPRKEIISVLLDSNRVGSLSNVLLNLSNANDEVRTLWPMDAWRVFDSILKSWSETSPESIRSLRAIVPLLDQLITRIMAHTGLIQESILLEQGQLLYIIGLRLEECLLSISKIRSLLVFQQEKQVEYELMEALLNSHESLNTYRYLYRSYLKPDNVIELLLLNDQYPRSLISKLHDISRHLSRLPYFDSANACCGYQNIAFEVCNRFRFTTSTDLAQVTENSAMRESLEYLLSSAFERLSQLSDSLTKTYFSHSYERFSETEDSPQVFASSQSQSQSQSSSGSLCQNASQQG